MNKLNNFPSINFISLNTSIERREKLNKQFLKYNIQNVTSHIVDHIDNCNCVIEGNLLEKVEKPALGATTSHLKAWKKWYETTNEPYTIFCEDDIILDTVEFWNFTWEEFFTNLPSDWECVQLSLIQEILTDINFRRRGLYDWGANIYLVKREYVKKVLDIRYPHEKFIFNIETKLPPVIEHVLYLSDHKVYMFPLFLEDVSIDSTVTPKDKHQQTFNNHIQSHNHVYNWWKTTGYKLKINEIIVKPKENDIYTKFALNTEDPEINFQIAQYYHDIGQTASAFTHYFRCAERTQDLLLKYECFLRSYFCFSSQGKRNFTAIFLLKQALTILPERPEAYYLLSKYHENNKDWMECYTTTVLAEKNCIFDGQPLRTWVDYPGDFSIYFQKAIAAWWLDKVDETWDLFNLLLDNFTLPESYINTINNNINNYYKDRVRIKPILSNNINIISPKTTTQTKKVVDCFSFNAMYGKEMLELRYHMLKDSVDYFVLSELNTTHTGKQIQFEAQKVIDELQIPKDKFIIIEVDTSQEDKLPIEDIDRLNCMYGNDKNIESVKSRCRERLQKDALLHVQDKFTDDTVFIHSDLDEIISPQYVEWFANVARQNTQQIIKVPLVYLQGKANLRTYFKDSDTPAPWDINLFLCTKDHLKKTTPTRIRSCKQTPYPGVYITLNNQIIQDAGWHFSWMGDKHSKKIKQESFIHFTDSFDFVQGGSYNNSEINDLLEQEPKENVTPPSGEKDKILKKYNINLLPKEIFTLERVKSFLLSKVSSQERIHLEPLQNILKGIYGFCSIKKACILIDLIQKYKPKITVELGVLGGSSLIPQALAIKQNKQGVIYAVDPWSEQESLAHTINDEHIKYWGDLDHKNVYEHFLQHVENYRLQHVVHIVKQTSDDASKLFDSNSIDLLHVDGNHSEEQSYKDVITYLPLVNKDGFILFDDVHWTDGGKNTTQKAVTYLKKNCNELQNYTDELGNCFTVFQKK